MDAMLFSGLFISLGEEIGVRLTGLMSFVVSSMKCFTMISSRVFKGEFSIYNEDKIQACLAHFHLHFMPTAIMFCYIILYIYYIVNMFYLILFIKSL